MMEVEAKAWLKNASHSAICSQKNQARTRVGFVASPRPRQRSGSGTSTRPAAMQTAAPRGSLPWHPPCSCLPTPSHTHLQRVALGPRGHQPNVQQHFAQGAPKAGLPSWPHRPWWALQPAARWLRRSSLAATLLRRLRQLLPSQRALPLQAGGQALQLPAGGAAAGAPLPS